MKRLIIFALVAATAWYGWNNRTRLFGGNTDSEAVIVNSATRAMLRVRLTVDGRTYVREVIEPEARVTIPFALARESDFRLRWDWRGLDVVPEWRGGEVTPGPTRSRCVIEVLDDGSATCSCTPMPTGLGGTGGS